MQPKEVVVEVLLIVAAIPLLSYDRLDVGNSVIMGMTMFRPGLRRLTCGKVATYVEAPELDGLKVVYFRLENAWQTPHQRKWSSESF